MAGRQFATILLIVFLGFLGISIPYLIFPALFLNPEYSLLSSTESSSIQALLLGITLAAYPLGQFIGSPILGALSDDYGRKWLLVGSLVVAALCYLITGLALAWQQLWLVIVGRFASGLMEGNIAIARAMAADIKTLSKHEAFGKINAAASTAYIIGPIVGGFLSDHQMIPGVTSATPFYIVSLLFVALAALSTFLLTQNAATAVTKKPLLARFNLVAKMATLFQNKQLRFLLISSTLFTLAIDIFYEFGPVYLTAKWMLSPAQLIVYNTVLCLTLAVGNGWVTSFFSKRYAVRKGIIGSIGGMGLLLLAMVFIEQPAGMVALFALSGLFISLGVTCLTVKISDAAPDHMQGEVMGTQVSLRVLGDGLICLLGGLLFLLSPKLILVLAAIISMATMAYFAVREVKQVREMKS